MPIYWLGDPACHDAAVVGAKAANLSTLAAEFRVPPGFAVPDLLATTEALPPALAAEIAAAYRALGERVGIAEPRVAVRSSALDEDGAAASFAGQHATYLNIVGEQAVLEAVVRCCASAASSSARAYRAVHDLGGDASGDEIRVAVLVQHLVPAEVSAVAFSANPVTGARDEVVINASWGLGESVVSGLVTPDTYIVRAPGFEVLANDIADKQVMTVPTTAGTDQAAVSEELRTRACLDAAQVTAVASLAHALAQRMGWPADIECAFAGGELYLLQCRPITTLS